MNLKEKIRDIENYPIDGIIFRDITTLLNDKDAYRQAVDSMVELAKGYNPDYIVGIEARGFIIGAAVAYVLGCGFVPVRKPGKLPYDKIRKDYGLEYGTDAIELHTDAVEKGSKVLIIDDLLATGGTCRATAQLLEELGAEVLACLFLIELDSAKGRDKLENYEVKSILHYE